MLRGSDSDDDDDGNSPIRLSKRNAKNQNEEKKKRIDSMREFLCDKNETRLCSMTDTELNELDNNNSNNKDEYLGRLLQKGSSSSKMPLMDEAYFDDLNKKLTEFIEFQNALDDLSLLSIHFPTGLCNLDTFKQKQNLSKQEHHNQKPKSINSDPNSDPNLKKKLMKNYGFIGLWTNMQKTFCGAKDPLNKQQHQKSFNNNNNTSNNDTETTDTTDSPSSAFESSLNLTPGQLKSLSFLFQIVYSNPVILYTPNTTVAYENLIKKSNGTFELLDKINTFFSQWLDTSKKLVDYLGHEKTNRSLSALNSFKRMALKLNNDTADDKTTTTTTTTTSSSLTRILIKNATLIESLRSVSNRSVDDLIAKFT
jgi:hypothetical protein